jgi:mono/diheme cytochrome c family protein
MEGLVGCGNCHGAQNETTTPPFQRSLSGGQLFDEPIFKVYAPNITPDLTTGIGNWTDAQLTKAIREGIRPDNSVIGPPMPISFYRNFSDKDLQAIITYLRAQPPIKHTVPAAQYRVPLPENYGPAITAVIEAPNPADQRLYGKYLVNIAHCMDCHNPRDEQGKLQNHLTGAGGQIFKGPWGVSISRNLTPDETGLKNWSDAKIAAVLQTGLNPGGVHYQPPMAFDFYKNIRADDLAAIITYLRTLAPLPFGGKK